MLTRISTFIDDHMAAAIITLYSAQAFAGLLAVGLAMHGR